MLWYEVMKAQNLGILLCKGGFCACLFYGAIWDQRYEATSWCCWCFVLLEVQDCLYIFFFSVYQALRVAYLM